jgi:hypothetical protein
VDLLPQLAVSVGLPETATQEEVVAAVEQMRTEITPIREATQEAQANRAFSQEFPEEYARMQKLEEKDRRSEAETFAARYERLTRKDGDKEVKTTIGFSARTMDAIAEAHLAFGEKRATITDLEEVLDSISETGLVEYSETGSSRFIERAAKGENEDSGVAFSQRIAEVMQADNLAYGAAVKIAADKYPEEFAEYRKQVKPREEVS